MKVDKMTNLKTMPVTDVPLGRKKTFADKFAVVDMLEKVKETGMGDSRYLTLKLLEMNFVEAVNTKGEGRGRLGLAKNWKRPTAA